VFLSKWMKWEKSISRNTIRLSKRKIQASGGFRPAGCYTFLKLKGVDCGAVRRPWREPNEKETRYMKKEAIKLGLFTETAPPAVG
jgi:hypothetical protein